MAAALTQGRVLVTLDKDFGALAVVFGQPHCGIVRLVDIEPSAQAAASRYRQLMSHEFSSDGRSALFRHVSADKAALYRAIMEAFAAAKRQFRLHLRPDEVYALAQWEGAPPAVVAVVESLLAELAAG